MLEGGEGRSQGVARFVVADDPDRDDRGAESGEVREGVCAATGHVHLPLVAQDDDRRFARHPLRRAEDEPVEHEVAEKRNRRAGQRVDDLEKTGRIYHLEKCNAHDY